MLILLAVAIVTFFVFLNRARLIGETRGIFWGFSGAAAVVAPAVIASFIETAVSFFSRFSFDNPITLLATIGAFCLVAGVFIGKWMLDRFLPIPSHMYEAAYEAAEEEIPYDD